jgi:predicted methyltransferase
MRETLVTVMLLALSAACAGNARESPPASSERSASNLPKEIQEIVDAPDRDEHDRKLDLSRKPGETLLFFGIKPGMKIFVLGAANGYTAELLGRAVGPSGVVYAHNTNWVLDNFSGPTFEARLAKPANKNIVKVVRDWTDPFPPEVQDLDAVFCVITYHDLFWFEGGVDRVKMNAAVLKALKQGGIYGIIDHSGRPGTGSTEVSSLHRIEEKVVREEVEKAGFVLSAEGSFLRNPQDLRDRNALSGTPVEDRGPSDRFVLKYVKP